MSTITRQQAKAGLANGQQPDGDFFADLIDSLVFKSDDIRELFVQHATETDALQGIDNTKIMTALRVKNALDKLKGHVSTDGDTLEKLRGLIRSLENIVLGNTDNNNAIDKWEELKTFLNGVTDTDTTLVTMMNRKQNVRVSDLKYSCQPANHDGWLLCHGQAVSRTTYARLFGIIHTWFGAGDGSTTFNLPDGRGRVPIQSGQNIPGLSYYLPGNKGGSERITLTTNQIPPHNHAVTDRGHQHTTIAGVVANWMGNGARESAYGWRSKSMINPVTDKNESREWDRSANVHTTSQTSNISIHNTGGGQPIDIRQPYLTIGNLFIYSGVTT